MVLIRFPDPRRAGPEGLVAFGGNLRAETLIEAYRHGIFPWPIENYPLPWFCPAARAILEFKDLHVPRRLLREMKRGDLKLTIDQAFPAVIKGCAAAPRPREDGTWITDQIIDAYCELHRRGNAHSVEAWADDGQLVGGLYGVEVDGAFGGESMFYVRPNASKLALLYLIRHLSARGLDWIDVQVLTPHIERLGAKLISRDVFLDKLAATRRRGLKLF